MSNEYVLRTHCYDGRMRRAAIVVLIVFACVALLWVAGAKVVSSMESDALDEPWPAGLGTAATVPQRYPPTVESDAARALRLFVVPPALRKELGEFVKQEIGRSSTDVAPLPSATGAFLAVHVEELDSLEQILTTQPIVWESDLRKPRRDAPLPNLRQVFDVQRLLLARALSRHDDRAAWDDLHATWSISRAMLRRPELIAAVVGIAVARNTNAVARTLPPPAPAWRDEMLITGYSRALIAALQADSWSTSIAINDYSFVDEDARNSVTAPLRRGFDFVLSPYRRHSAAALMRAERETAAVLYATGPASSRRPRTRAKWSRGSAAPTCSPASLTRRSTAPGAAPAGSGWSWS
jgi:hypothetical protein